ncbi:hypothetical protein [Ruixingdingia sedimenti]|uniref:Uncharacterized protein n=1 Tax=Ruixingdingia sedimenti TaxID=3073604 RepID=A0ABU1F2A1_9RHOB|nr:hypothetical protein [Xinfangfangia sp. LG-4]MDR5650990.1 hypothetical protein [Xinfangfangia sp. LG-4]
MTRKSSSDGSAADSRQARLESALRANLARRKAQSRARAEPPAPAEDAGQTDDKAPRGEG